MGANPVKSRNIELFPKKLWIHNSAKNRVLITEIFTWRHLYGQITIEPHGFRYEGLDTTIELETNLSTAPSGVVYVKQYLWAFQQNGDAIIPQAGLSVEIVSAGVQMIGSKASTRFAFHVRNMTNSSNWFSGIEVGVTFVFSFN